MAGGWIKLYRSVFDTLIWQSNEPYDKRSAWIYLIGHAVTDEKTIVYRGHKIILQRGQFFTSERRLAREFRWYRTKVRTYLRTLIDTEMITANNTTDGTILTIVNYGVYQDLRTTNSTTNDTANNTTNSTTNKTSNRTKIKKKEEKNKKKDNNISPPPEGAADEEEYDDPRAYEGDEPDPKWGWY